MVLPSLRLRTFGGLAVERDGVPIPGIAARRRPLVLLAFVATHGDVGVSRDAACATLWPESDDERARNSLKQAVFALRRELGADVLATVATTLRVDRTRLAVDVLDFADALDRDDLETAEALYRGAFFEHGTVAGLDALERWASGERERMTRAAAQLFESLAARHTAAGDRDGAVVAWRRRAALDPTSTHAAAGLMKALCAAGDRTAALEHWRVHALLVRDQLESEPDPSLADLAAQIRATLTPPAALRAVPTPPPGAPRAESPVVVEVAEPSSVEQRPASLPDFPAFLSGEGAGPPRDWGPPPRPPQRPWWHVRRRFLQQAMLAFCVGALAPLSLSRRSGRVDAAEPVGSPDLVAVLPFADRSDGVDGAAHIGRGIADLVSVAIHGAGSWQAVPSSALLADDALRDPTPLDASDARALARRFGAGRYLLGDVVRDGQRLHLSASLHGARGEVIAQASATTRVGQLDEAAERLVVGLLTQQLAAPADRVARVAAASAGSLGALKAWLSGEALYRDHRYADAIEAFADAERRDPRFALAYYRHAIAADLLGDGAQADSAAARAVRLSDALPESERTLLRAWRDARVGAVERAESRYESLADDVPDHAEAWFRLGELRFHANPARGRSVTDARGAFERAVAIDPRNAEALMYLARIAALEGRLHDADTLVARARRVSADTRTFDLRAVRTFAVGEGLLQGRALRTLQRAGDGDGSSAVDLAVYRDDVDGTLAFARALRAAGASRELRSLSFRLEAIGAAARGQVGAAGTALDSLATLDGFAALRLRAMLATHPLLAGASPDARRELAARLLPERGPSGPTTESSTRRELALRRYWRGLLAVADRDEGALGREAGALAALASLTPHDPVARSLAVSLAARGALLAGRPGEALHLLEDARVDPQQDPPGALSGIEAADRFLRAEVLHQLGRDDEAVGFYASIAERATYELPWLAPAQLRLGEIASARGDVAGAADHYRRFVALWWACDPSLRPLTTTARESLARLAPPKPSRAPTR